MVPGRFEIELAAERTHPHVRWNAYYAVRQLAGSLGFHHLGDVDIISLHHDPTLMRRAVLAVFASDDGTNVLGHYRLPLRWTMKGLLAWFMGARGDFFDVGTNFGGGEGVMVETTTAQAATVWDVPDFIRKETMASDSALEDVIRRHRVRVQDYQSRHPDARPVAVHTLRDVVEISNVMEVRKLRWRRERRWVTRDELERLSRLEDSALDRLYEAVQHAAREQ